MTRAEIIAREDAEAAAEDAAYALAQTEAAKPKCACGSSEDLSYRWGVLVCQKCISASI